MPSSVSGQDNQILRCDWLSCPLGTARRVLQEKFPRTSYDKSFIDQVCPVKMAGYWPRSISASFWTSTPSRSKNPQKKSSANIQPSWPQNWSITHIEKTKYCIVWRVLKCFFSQFCREMIFLWLPHCLMWGNGWDPLTAYFKILYKHFRV